jgi:hypothetical protein
MTLDLPLRLALLIVIAFAAALPVSGALPPSAYAADQEKSPEVLVIEVLSVKSEVTSKREGTVTSVRAQARVLEVKRIASNLKPGAEIAIAYTNFEAKGSEKIVGPSSWNPVLQNGQKVPAFLSGNQKMGYSPAARIYSFEPVR